MRLSEYSKYRANRERAEAILRLLEGEPDKTLKDDKGQLTRKVMSMLPKHLAIGRNLKSSGTSVMNAELRRMEDAGWICLDVLGRRTFMMVLVDYPEDWVKPEVKENVEAVYTGPELIQMSAATLEEPPLERVPEVDPNQLTFDEVLPTPEPTRITTSQLRTLIHDEVQAAMDDWFTQMMLRFYERKGG